MRWILMSSLCLLALSTAATGCSDEKKGHAGGAGKGMKDDATPKGSEHNGMTCDGASEGEGFCDDDYLVFCDGGEWYELDCYEAGGYCDYDGDIVDCFFD